MRDRSGLCGSGGTGCVCTSPGGVGAGVGKSASGLNIARAYSSSHGSCIFATIGVVGAQPHAATVAARIKADRRATRFCVAGLMENRMPLMHGENMRTGRCEDQGNLLKRLMRPATRNAGRLGSRSSKRAKQV